MRLGILCTMINGFGKRGFYNSQEIGLGRALVKRGHSVVIYKCVPKSEEADGEVIEPGLKIRYIPVFGIGAHGYLKSRFLSRKLNALLCFSDNQLFLPHIYRFCKKNQIVFVPYIGTAHGLWGDFRSRVSDCLFSIGTLKFYKNYSVLAKTEAAKEELLSLGVKEKNITVAPVGLDTSVLKKDFEQYDKNQLKEKYGFAKEDTIICNVARLQPEKRPLDLIDVFLKVKDKKEFRLLIVGQGPLRDELDEKIAEHHLENQVHIIEHVPYEQIWEIYRISDYFLNLNREEIFGMAIMEAVYYKTSVAASDALGPRTTLKGMEGHKICMNDREMEEWLLAKYPSKEQLEESAAKIEQNFTWDVCEKAFLKLIREKKQNQ